MVNRSGEKGTFAETAVAGYLRENGWPYAERKARTGAFDKGDITGTPGLAWEVKYAGSGLRMGEWIGETMVERLNAHAKHGILVIKPPRLGLKRIDQWFAVMVNWDFEDLWSLCQVRDARLLTRAPEGYAASRVGDQLFAIGNVAQPDELPVLTLRPRGMKDHEANWYRVMTLGTMVRMLRTAGFGEPL